MEPLAALLADPLAFTADADPTLRRLAVAGLAPDDHRDVLMGLLGSDPSADVRAAAAEALGRTGPASVAALLSATADGDADVVEAAVTALGSIGTAQAVDRLLELAQSADDRLVQEAAVASLGAIGDDRAVATLLELVASGPPQVRRRCVAALTVFESPLIEPALLAAREDRNPMVREAAEMVVGRELPALGCSPLLNLELPPA